MKEELFRALAALADPPGPESVRLAELLELGPPADEATWSDLFLFQLYPYASVYLGPEGQIGGEARDRVAGFWRALGLKPPPEPDHLAVMLSFYAELLARQAEAGSADDRRRWRHVQRAFLHEHLLSWLPPYLTKLEGVAPPFYSGWARLLGRGLADECRRLGRREETPVQLERRGPLVDPREAGADAFLDFLLAPLASGLLLVRSDLERAARQTGLGARLAERRFGLKSLLSQDGGATLGWLRGEAEGWGRRLAGSPLAEGAATDSWRRRAAATAELLASLESGAAAG